MKKFLKLVALCVPLQVAASPQDDRAAVIERLSDTYASSATIAAAAPIGGSKIMISGCSMTIVSTTQYPDSTTKMGFSSRINLSEITFGSPNRPDVSFMMTGEGVEFEDHGIIPFSSATPYPAYTHGPLPDLLGPEETLAFTVVRESEMIQSSYIIAQTTPAEIERLAQALVAYQQDYCRPVS